MGNAASSRPGLFRRTRLVAISAVVGVLAIAAIVATLVLLPMLNRPVHASGVGFGCTPTSAPVCTFTGQTGFATFEATTSCTVTDIFVFANANFSRSGATTQTSSALQLDTEAENTCTGVYSEGIGWASDATVQSTSGSLTIQGSVDVENFNPDDGTTSTTTYTVNLTWKGFGKSSRLVESNHFQSAGFIVQSKQTGTSQSALVTGTLSDGTTNFAGSSPTFGESLSADSGTFLIIQK